MLSSRNDELKAVVRDVRMQIAHLTEIISLQSRAIALIIRGYIDLIEFIMSDHDCHLNSNSPSQTSQTPAP